MGAGTLGSKREKESEPSKSLLAEESLSRRAKGRKDRSRRERKM